MVRSIVRSIWRTSAILLACQAAIGTSIVLAYNVDWYVRLEYAVGLLTAHLLLGYTLSRLSDLFITVPEGRVLSKVNLANLFSMIRISSAPTLVLLIVLLRTIPVGPVLIPFASIVFLTDLADGAISRRTGTITKIGRFLDSSSDYLVLVVVAVALRLFTVVHNWFFVILALRFGLQILGQIVLFVRKKGKIDFRSSFLGKASVFATMTFFAIAFLGLAGMPAWYTAAVGWAEIVVAVILIVSLLEKAVVFAGDLRIV